MKRWSSSHTSLKGQRRKRGREGEKGKGNLDLLFLGHALGKRKRERMRETKVANYEWPMNISPCESTKSRERES